MSFSKSSLKMLKLRSKSLRNVSASFKELSQSNFLRLGGERWNEHNLKTQWKRWVEHRDSRFKLKEISSVHSELSLEVFLFGLWLNYLGSIASIWILAARERATRINSRVFCRRVLTSLSFTLPSRELIRVLTIKSHRFLSPLGESSIITCCLFIDIWIDIIT